MLASSLGGGRKVTHSLVVSCTANAFTHQSFPLLFPLLSQCIANVVTVSVETSMYIKSGRAQPQRPLQLDWMRQQNNEWLGKGLCADGDHVRGPGRNVRWEEIDDLSR